MRIAPWVVSVCMTFAAPVSAATINPNFDGLTPRAFSSFIEEGASTSGSLGGLAGGLPRAVADLLDDAHALAGDTLSANTIAMLVSSDCSAHNRSTLSPAEGGACSGQSGAGAKESVGAELSISSLLNLPNGKTIDLSGPPHFSPATVSPVPVPATLTLLLTGCGLLYLVAQRRRATT